MLDYIKKDLMTLNGKYFGVYDAEPFSKDSEVIQCVEFIKNNFKEVYPFGTRKNYDDFIFKGWKCDEINEDFNTCVNSYNWSACVVLQARFFEYMGRNFTAVAFHRFGDVRGNYTPYAILDCNKDFFMNGLCELSFDIPSDSDWSISQYFFDEAGFVRAWNSATEESFEGYCESDETPEEIKKAVKEWY